VTSDLDRTAAAAVAKIGEAPPAADLPSPEQLQDTALLIRAACRPDTPLRTLALSAPSFRAVARGMIPLNDLDTTTALLRSGLGLGLIRQG
jgi:hypothetical protein